MTTKGVLLEFLEWLCSEGGLAVCEYHDDLGVFVEMDQARYPKVINDFEEHMRAKDKETAALVRGS